MKVFIAVILWVVGLNMAGSDSPFMPWVNILGLIIFFCSNIVIGRAAQRRKNRLYYERRLNHR